MPAPALLYQLPATPPDFLDHPLVRHALTAPPLPETEAVVRDVRPEVEAIMRHLLPNVAVPVSVLGVPLLVTREVREGAIFEPDEDTLMRTVRPIVTETLHIRPLF